MTINIIRLKHLQPRGYHIQALLLSQTAKLYVHKYTHLLFDRSMY